MEGNGCIRGKPAHLACHLPAAANLQLAALQLAAWQLALASLQLAACSLQLAACSLQLAACSLHRLKLGLTRPLPTNCAPN